MRVRVVIVDDHDVVRLGLRFVLEQAGDIVVVGEGGDGVRGVSLVTGLLPDVALVDLLMPRMEGVATIREIKRLAPSTQVIVLTSYYEDDQIFAAIKAGALSYLLKDTKARDLVAAARAAARGESVLHPMVATRILQDIRQTHLSPLADLTARELDVLRCITQGRSNREIATDLSISEQTVKTHVSNILSKLHLADRTQAAIYALQEGLGQRTDSIHRPGW